MKQLVIKNGVLVDKKNNILFAKKDLYIKDGLIEEIGEDINVPGAEVIDAEGKYVSAGFIDIHIHNNLKPQPGRKNEPAPLDSVDEIGVFRGATTVIECGSWCVQDFEEFVGKSDEAKSRYYTLLSGHGEEGFGTLGSQDVSKIIPEHYYEIVEKHPGYVLGLKVANSNTITNDKGYGLTAHAKKIAKHLGMPLTIHIGNFPPDPLGLIEFLEEGDVVTHTYHGKEVSLFKADGTPKEGVVRARERGVLFDVGHGSASFSFSVYDRARRKGFLPDMISTDIRAVNIHGPVFSLATVMSKMYNLDMPLEDVVEKVTAIPAKTYHLNNLGELKKGLAGDIEIFGVEDVDLELVDCYHNYQRINKLIVPSTVVVSKHGESQVYEVKEGRPE